MQVRLSGGFVAILSALLLGVGLSVSGAFEPAVLPGAESPQSAEQGAPPAELPAEEPGNGEPAFIEDEAGSAPLESDEADEPSPDSDDATDADEELDEADGLTPDDLPLPADPPPAGNEAADEATANEHSAQPRPVAEPIEFDGVRPGRSTIEEAQSVWGEPVQGMNQGEIQLHTFAREPFERIEVASHQGRVVSITIALREQFSPETIAKQLGIAVVHPVLMTTESGAWIGQAYPERGVLLRFAPAVPAQPGKDPAAAVKQPTPRISQVVLTAIDPLPFIERSEARLGQDDTACLMDLATAIDLDPSCARAWWLRSCVLADLGQRDAALAAADEALGLEPDHPEYRLTHSRILAEGGQFEEAIDETKQVIEKAGLEARVHARGLAQLGDQLAASRQRDYQGALEYHLQAIRVAQPLTGDRRANVRRSARRTLIEAHLAVAQDIAWGQWKQKEEVVPKWLERARRIADESVAVEGLDADVRLRVESQSLAACVGVRGKIDPAQFAKQALEIGRQAVDQCADSLRRQRLQWQFGLAMYDALQALHLRGQHDEALRYGRLAVDSLEQGMPGRQESPGDAYLLGRLYFRLGSIYAQDRQQHDQAIAWYEKAIPLLERPVPPSALGDTGRQGETLITAALSYWTEGDRDKAVQLTSYGVELMEQAVEEGLLPARSLSVGYANLATMYRELGRGQEARNYTLRASKIAASEEEQDR